MEFRSKLFSPGDLKFLQLALSLARRGYGMTSPNPMVGAVLVKRGRIIGRGWHRGAGWPHAEIEAIHAARSRGFNVKNSTLHVTLEPCSTRGRTPPCTTAIMEAGIKRVVIGAIDPNPKHSGRALKLLKRAGIKVTWPGDKSSSSRLIDECVNLNESFNHWIVHHTPFVTVKSAMTLDGKIATAGGESKWITGARARAYGMKLRQGADAILVGVNTILADDPALTLRSWRAGGGRQKEGKLRRIILDSMARTPVKAKVVSDDFAILTTIVVSRKAPRKRIQALAKHANVMIAPLVKSASPASRPTLDLRWILKKLGAENVTSLLVEGGGEVNASFLLGGIAHRVVCFYAPKILGGREARKAVSGEGVTRLNQAIRLQDVEWKEIGDDLMLTGRVAKRES